MNRIGRVLGTTPFIVAFYGDTTGVAIDLKAGGYEPAINDQVWLVEVAEGQWMAVDRVVTP